MSSELIEMTEMAMEETLAAVLSRLSKLRTGKASPVMLDGLRVEYYGAQTPLNQLASVSAPEARLLTIKPFDRNTIGDIEKAIVASNLGLNPANDGMLIRIPIPELTGERRKEFSKMARDIGEDGKVGVRHARQDANDQLKKALKDSEISEDEMHSEKDVVQKLTDSFCDKVVEVVKEKETEILEI